MISLLGACIQEVAKLNEEDLSSALILHADDSSSTLGEPTNCVLP